jgi:hypothetical protein
MNIPENRSITREDIKNQVDEIPDRLLKIVWLQLSSLAIGKQSTVVEHTALGVVADDFLEGYDENRCPRCSRRIYTSVPTV